MQKREYNAAKAIAMLLVVFGHAQVFSFGDVSWAFPTNTFRDRLEYIISFIYSFHIPLFFAISGALFRTTEDKQMTCGLLLFLKKKAMRLLVPYVGCFLLLLAPARYLVGYYSTDLTAGIPILLLDMIGLGDNGHLWFLLTLFLVYVLFYCIDMLNKRHKNIVILMSIIILYLISFSIPDRFDTSIRYLMWFGVGYYFDLLYFKRLRQWTANTLLFASILCFFITVFCFCTMKRVDGIIEIPISILNTTMGIFCVLLASFVCARIQWKFFRSMEKNSYSIYLFHDPINYLFLFTIDKLVCISSLSEGQYAVIIALKIVTSLTLSIGMCQCCSFLKKEIQIFSGKH